jgi:hypothetical protein
MDEQHDDEVLHLVAGEKPASFAKAEREDCWHHAMLDEMQSIDDNHTWTFTPLPAGQRGVQVEGRARERGEAQGPARG